MTEAIVTGTVSEARVNRFLAQVYLIMSVGLVVTAVVSTWVSTSLKFQFRLFTSPTLGFGLFILQIIVVVALSASVMRLSPGVAFLLFLFYAALVGVTISSIFLIYGQEQVYTVFWVTAGTFLVTSLVGLLIKKDMSGFGHFLFMLLLGWIVAYFFSYLFRMPNINWGLTFVGIALFVGLTAWDTQRLKQIGQQIDDHPARGGIAVLGALNLYLDFINLFLLMLRAASR